MVFRLVRSAWGYRGFVVGSIKREIQARYRSSALGALWAVLGPLAMITVYTVIFSEIMRARLPGSDDPQAYSIYLCSGILVWGFFSEALARCINVFVENSNLIQKLNFPRVCLPIIVVGDAMFNFLIVFVLFLTYLVIVNRFPGAELFAVIPLLVIQVFLIVGLGILLAVLNVFFRDIGRLVAILLQFWFWLTPVVYPVAIVPDRFQVYIQANPMTQLLGAYQDIFVRNMWPDWPSIVPLAIASLALCVLGAWLYRAKSGEMVDEL